MTKRIFIVILAVLATSAMFAQNPRNENLGGRNGGRANNDGIIGTVKSVNEDSSSIIVTNSDGEDIKIVVNPKTRLVEAPSERPQAGGRALGERPQRRKTGDANRTPPPQLALTDISAGDWVQVSVNKSDTVAKDALRIQVVKKK